MVWASNGQDGDLEGVYAQRYQADGAAAGSEFRVNTYTTGNQTLPVVAMDSAGDFVIAWESYGQGGSEFSIYARRFDAAGNAQGSEQKVNTYSLGSQTTPSIAMDAGGDFVVAWQSYGQVGFENSIYARRFNASGAAQGSEFRVDTVTSTEPILPVVAIDAIGDFVIAWQSYARDGSSYGIYAQRYNAGGADPGKRIPG